MNLHYYEFIIAMLCFQLRPGGDMGLLCWKMMWWYGGLRPSRIRPVRCSPADRHNIARMLIREMGPVKPYLCHPKNRNTFLPTGWEEGGPGELGTHDGETEMSAGSSWGHNPGVRREWIELGMGQVEKGDYMWESRRVSKHMAPGIF